MKVKSYTYICPLSNGCLLNKKCHVLTTKRPLDKPIVVKQLCPVLGKTKNGKQEIEITIG